MSEAFQDRRGDDAAIARLIRSIFDSFTVGDVGGLDACLDDDATIWDVFTPELIVGRAARDDFHQHDRAQMQDRGRLHLTVHEPLVTVHGGVAWARYLVDFRYEPPGAAQGRVRCTDVLIRRPDGWRVAHHHEGLSP